MNITNRVRLSFLLITVIVIFLGAINSIVWLQIKDNHLSRKHLASLIFIQEQMDAFTKDLIDSTTLKEIDVINQHYLEHKKKFDRTKTMFLDHHYFTLRKTFIDESNNSILRQNMQILFQNEKKIETAFNQLVNLHQNKIYLRKDFNKSYLQEAQLRKKIKKAVLQTKDFKAIQIFGEIAVYSKETLYQKKDHASLDHWLFYIDALKKYQKSSSLSQYESVVKTLGSSAINIAMIDKKINRLSHEIFHTIHQNRKVNAFMRTKIENITMHFIDSTSIFILVVLIFLLFFIVFFEYRTSHVVALSVDEIEAKVQEGLKEITKLDKEIIETQKEVIFTMGTIGEQRSKETGNHVKRVAEYSKLFARFYGLSEEETEMIGQVSPMHDIGKVAIPDSILNKPGKLSDAEREIMNTHTTLGYEMLKGSNKALLKMAAIVAKEHHEKWDGSGYPEKKAGEEIHIFGRITAIADVFDALGSDRVYKKAWKDEDIFTLLKEERGRHFEPKLVDIFFEHMDEFLKIRDTFKD
ncbi:HD-GYP domain-containing protein [Sulfurospirillum sp. 1612]|uniref:HD-GYP domain-containing protein n=1 Tax=Sulfurospirillum sp. 1612 TaxID=3094835 RepID=UPI002F95A167